MSPGELQPDEDEDVSSSRLPYLQSLWLKADRLAEKYQPGKPEGMTSAPERQVQRQDYAKQIPHAVDSWGEKER